MKNAGPCKSQHRCLKEKEVRKSAELIGGIQHFIHQMQRDVRKQENILAPRFQISEADASQLDKQGDYNVNFVI